MGDFCGPDLAGGHITSVHSLSSVVYSAAREAGKRVTGGSKRRSYSQASGLKSVVSIYSSLWVTLGLP